MNATQAIEKNIFLLTDDYNAIGEAHHEFPNRNWMYINCTCYRGIKDGWEQQLPLQDPIYEVTVLLSIFCLVPKCSGLIKGDSGFAKLLHNHILEQN